MTTNGPQKKLARPTRVLHLIDTGGPGGAEMVLDTLVRNLDPGRWESRVIVPKDDWLSERLRSHEVDTVVLPPGGAADIGYLRALIREARDFGPALIHTHLLGSAVYGSLAAPFTGGQPLVCTFHGRPDVSPSDRLLWLKARILARRRNRIAYVSRDLREYLEPLLGTTERNGLVVYNGIEFREPQTNGKERAECGAGPDDVLVGAVGNVRPAKDFATLVEAAAIVCRARDDARFVILGDQRSPLMQPLEEQLERLGLTDRVRFIGFRHNPADYVVNFDVFVSSSTTEGLPLGIVEAVGLGTPVVLTRVGGVPEVVESGRTGLLVPSRDPGELAAGILRTLEDSEEAQRMAAVGARDVRDRFDVARMCEGYERLYDSLLG